MTNSYDEHDSSLKEMYRELIDRAGSQGASSPLALAPCGPMPTAPAEESSSLHSKSSMEVDGAADLDDSTCHSTVPAGAACSTSDALISSGDATKLLNSTAQIGASVDCAVSKKAASTGGVGDSGDTALGRLDTCEKSLVLEHSLPTQTTVEVAPQPPAGVPVSATSSRSAIHSGASSVHSVVQSPLPTTTPSFAPASSATLAKPAALPMAPPVAIRPAAPLTATTTSEAVTVSLLPPHFCEPKQVNSKPQLVGRPHTENREDDHIQLPSSQEYSGWQIESNITAIPAAVQGSSDFTKQRNTFTLQAQALPCPVTQPHSISLRELIFGGLTPTVSPICPVTASPSVLTFPSLSTSPSIPAPNSALSFASALSSVNILPSVPAFPSVPALSSVSPSPSVPPPPSVPAATSVPASTSASHPRNVTLKDHIAGFAPTPSTPSKLLTPCIATATISAVITGAASSSAVSTGAASSSAVSTGAASSSALNVSTASLVAVALSNGVNVTKSSTAKDACDDALVVAATIVPDSGKEKKEKKDKNKESVISKKRSAVEPVAQLAASETILPHKKQKKGDKMADTEEAEPVREKRKYVKKSHTGLMDSHAQGKVKSKRLSEGKEYSKRVSVDVTLEVALKPTDAPALDAEEEEAEKEEEAVEESEEEEEEEEKEEKEPAETPWTAVSLMQLLSYRPHQSVSH